ncbi:Na+/H+ antiporter subunit E [Sediminicurvatus halobius]|uniref:Cation transporter n=1 Tax=Sediminicurvatus halobius TaxID=2182432 RepID=A0A2U2N7T6_9GAMM|nr:Na+/H+ antiporter subunit E [Spiribacter halobius]PWG65127.1 cation transporter [Spiribacter halobius]UEX78924.1 Na+/H+ antiporter subunit E [Spiribacter halobius]
MRYLITLSLLLALLWLGISGVYKPLILLLGAASVALVVWLAERMEVLGAEHDPGLFSWRLPGYWAWLVWQIVLANIAVARSVLNPERIRPQVVRVPVPLHTPVAKVTYGNSVTLTPGTVTLALSRDEMIVHALLEEAAEDLRGGAMAERIAWLEGHPPQWGERNA